MSRADESGQRRAVWRHLLIRICAVGAAALGINYIVWRWLFSVRWSAWWISVPLVVAETYSLLDSLLFGLTMWRARRRPAPPVPADGLTVDVFITTYNEPIDLVMRTALAAKAIRYPHETFILDDGARAELRAAAEENGIRWISRSADWANRPRHAKAGNLNNALLSSHGEFLLILDADQIPDPSILDRTLGYFADEKMALVQTPQYFVNVPAGDPMGSQAPLFYGPIQQGKDGWNAAFFCGSNAVIRREALMQLGIANYVQEVDRAVRAALRTADRVLERAMREVAAEDSSTRAALVRVRGGIATARAELKDGVALGDVTYRFQRLVAAASCGIVEHDASVLQADLAAIAALSAEAGGAPADGAAGGAPGGLLGGLPAGLGTDEVALDRLAERDWSPLGALDAVRELLASVDVDRADEAQPIMPMATISVTEDMATSMRMHALGWRSAYHDEVLALGLAPEDLPSMLTQRLRWAQGTMQVMFRENPLLKRGLSLPQRLMYFATMWSYLSGFAAVVYIAAPVSYLLFGVLPVHAFSGPFFLRLVPFLIVNQLLFLIVADGRPTWRGQQYSLALFPIWIRAVVTAIGNVYLGRSLGFAVTPKTRTSGGGTQWRLIRVQLAAMALLAASAVVGLVRLAEHRGSVLGESANVVWILYDIVVFGVLLRAARYRGFETDADPAAENGPS